MPTKPAWLVQYRMPWSLPEAEPYGFRCGGWDAREAAAWCRLAYPNAKIVGVREA